MPFRAVSASRGWGYSRVMAPAPLTLLLLSAALLAPGCAGPRPSASELEWQRGQCAQIVDRDARVKCLERVESQ